MTLLQAVILGIFQGIAEFLPISSSGHLVLLENIFKINEGEIFFTVMLHFGTLISILIVYFKDICKIVVSFFQIIGKLFSREKVRLDNESKVLTVMLIVGTIATGLIYIVFGDFFESLYSSLVAVGIALIVTGFLLMISERTNSGRKTAKNMTIVDAIIVGLFQGFAIIPGVSRAGSTIVGGLFRGFDKTLATKFSFLMAIPAIGGASLIELLKVLFGDQSVGFSLPLLVGVILSTVTGVFAIRILIRVLERGKLYYFSYYVWAIGGIIILTQFL
ncbi:undecaprenyl-diphosphate phosphatase [Sporosalibacterium faouarense]|uniref:undecaprenyl-diphosphate phosphatase n=1 Tax=Sporosalibacterium faouarense TaxID=516123 RepID=UPI00141C2816|nr:undecaprenyl-diphosphate phosphatase [Sporosalibacterium faouarense]MTI48053.1 undecaprenyl-diphosphate phosphatase [Bacillota bacterium]